MERMERIGLNDIVSILTAKNEKFTKEDAAEFLKEWIAVIADSLADDKQVEVTGFGTFIFSQIREGETNELIEAGNEEVPYYYRIGFTPHETLRNSVNIFFSNFEPSLLSEGVTFDALPEVIATEAGEEEYIFNHIKKMVSLPRQQIPEPEIQAAGITAAEDMNPEDTIDPDEAPEPVPPVTNILSESLQSLSPEPRLSHRTTHHERVRKRRKTTTIWVPILGGMAIILAGLFFFRETHGKSGSDNL